MRGENKMLRIRLFYNLVIKSVWFLVDVVVTLLGNIQTIIGLCPSLSGWIERYIMNEPIRLILGWFANSWGYLLLLSISVAIFEGFYRKTKKYLGDIVKVNLNIEEFPQNNSPVPHLSFKLINHENVDIENCYGTLLGLWHNYTPNQILDINEDVNPNNKSLSWGGGSDTERITLPRSDGVNHGVRVLNICKSAANGVMFLFHGHEHNYPQGGIFRAKIKIDGQVGGTPIQSIGAEFCFNYGIHGTITRQSGLKDNVRQRIIIQTSSINSFFTFEDCDQLNQERKLEGN